MTAPQQTPPQIQDSDRLWGRAQVIVDGQSAPDVSIQFHAGRSISGLVVFETATPVDLMRSRVIFGVTDRVSELAGRLTEATGQPGSDYTIIVAFDDRRYWTPGSRRILTTRPGTDGAYVLRGLPPGSYHLAAVTDMEPGGQFDPEFLSALAGASTRVTILEGAKQVQDLRVAR